MADILGAEKFLSSLFLFVAEGQSRLAHLKIIRLSRNPQAVTELLLQNERLRHQVQMYKAANVLLCKKLNKQNTAFSFLEKVRILYLMKKWGLSARCVKNYFPLSPRTFERWLRQLRQGFFHLIPKSRKPRRSTRTPKGIEALVCRMKSENPLWGYVRLSAELSKLGICRSPNTVKEILKRNGSMPEPEEDERIQTVETKRPHEMWAMDITTVRIFNLIPVYLFCMIDDFSRCALGYAVTLRPTSQWVIGVLEKTAERFGVPRRILTDNGGQFLSDEFKQFAAHYKICHVRTRPYHPQTNGKIERFFKSLKYELLNYFFLTNMRQLDSLVSEYITYYNHYRPHQGIDNAIPAEKLQGNVRRLKPLQPARAVTRITFAGILHAYLPRAA